MTETQKTWTERKAGSVETLTIHLEGAGAFASLASRTDLEAAEILARIAGAEEALASARREVVRLERRAGRTWADVGELLGISRQAAQQRFGDVTL